MKTVLLTLVLGYAGIACAVWLLQEKLLFYPRAITGPPQPPAGWRLDTVALTTADGTRIAGVLVVPPVERPPLVIYFGGNAEEVTGYAPHVEEIYGERAALLVNYRGYGESAGSPGERALVADAIEIHDWAVRHGAIDGARVAIHGRSLGSGVAVQLAAARPAKCVVLTSPFASALDIAKEMYPWLPVTLLLRHPFDSAARAPQLRMPLLVLVGEADTLIPPRHSERLASLWGGAVERAAFEGFGHNDIDLHPRYATVIRAFLDRHL